MSSKKASVNIIKSSTSNENTRTRDAIEQQFKIIQHIVKENDKLIEADFQKEERITGLEKVIQNHKNVLDDLKKKNEILETTQKDLTGTEQNLFAILAEIGKSLTDEKKDEIRKKEKAYCAKYDLDLSRY